MKTNSILAFVLGVVALSITTTTAQADTSQYGQYEGTPPSQVILLDKMVSSSGTENKGGASTSTYVDNLSSSDYRYKPSEYVYFKLTVKNSSEKNLENVVVTDELPEHVDFAEASTTVENNNGIITIRVGSLKADEEKVYYIAARVRNQNDLPSDKGLFCLTNQAFANADNANEDSDTAQFCVEKQVIGVQKVPEAGPEMWLLVSGAQFAALGLGIYLKKRA